MVKKRKTKVLFVDDDERTLNIVAKHLASKGYEVLTSTSPFVAPILEKEEPDILILDINMPLLSGDRIADIISSQGYTDNMPIVFFSSIPQEVIESISSRFPTAVYVPKQNGLDALTSKLERLST
jgi:DNA-binding response OmpR family regulator